LVKPISPAAPALVTLKGERLELADKVTKNDGAVAWHHSHPSTRNARSICAVAISTSGSFLLYAAFSNSSAAKSQCGRVWPGANFQARHARFAMALSIKESSLI
jgi:hypothetical protein